jgi:hypothetical protein
MEEIAYRELPFSFFEKMYTDHFFKDNEVLLNLYPEPINTNIFYQIVIVDEDIKQEFGKSWLTLQDRQSLYEKMISLMEERYELYKNSCVVNDHGIICIKCSLKATPGYGSNSFRKDNLYKNVGNILKNVFKFKINKVSTKEELTLLYDEQMSCDELFDKGYFPELEQLENNSKKLLIIEKKKAKKAKRKAKLKKNVKKLINALTNILNEQ